MKLKTTLFGNVYQFKDVKEVLAKANELRSGDVLAGVAAASSQERVAETHSPERRAPRTDKPVVAKHNGKRRRHAVGILASGAICHGLPAAVCREAVVDVASADAGMGVRELHPIPDLNKLTQRRFWAAIFWLIIILPAYQWRH